MAKKARNGRIKVRPLNSLIFGLIFQGTSTTFLADTSVNGKVSLSEEILDGVGRSQLLEEEINSLLGDVSKESTPTHCQKDLDELRTANDLLWLQDVSFAIHRNGDPMACGLITTTPASFVSTLKDINECEFTNLNRYTIESFLTALFVNELGTRECGSPDNATAPQGLAGFCDMGPARTVKQPDFEKLSRLPKTGSLPCRFFTREGLRIDSLSSLESAARKALNRLTCQEVGEDCPSGPILHLYAVPTGRMFMLAPIFVGEKFVIDHVPDAKTIVAEVLSLVPRVFELHDFYSLEEASNLIDEALSETSETHKLHRSTTGATDGKVYS